MPKIIRNEEFISHEEMVNVLRSRVEDSTQAAVAEEIGLSRSAVNEILSGRKSISEHFGLLLGYQRELMFRKIA